MSYIYWLVKRKVIVTAGFILAALALALLWWLSPLREALSAARVLAQADWARANPLFAVLVPGLFVMLSLAMVPVVLLRAGIVLVFGPLLGPLLAIVSVALATLVGHALGQLAGSRVLERLAGPRLEKVRARLGRGGVLSIAALRLVPLGPHMLVSAVAGAARLPRRTFVVGTVLGMIPGLVLLVCVGGPAEALLRAAAG